MLSRLFFILPTSEIIFAQVDLQNVPQNLHGVHGISLINTTQETELIVNNT